MLRGHRRGRLQQRGELQTAQCVVVARGVARGVRGAVRCVLVRLTLRAQRQERQPPGRQHGRPAGPVCVESLRSLGDEDAQAATVVDAVLQPAVSQEAALEAIARLHPAARDIDILPSLDGWRPPAAETSDASLPSSAVQSAIRGLGKGSAHGLSSWTFALLRAIIYCDPTATDNWDIVLTAFLNRMLNGELRRDWWTPHRAVLIPKASGSVRPLGIEDMWYRLLGKAVVRWLGEDLSGKLLPDQFGVGVRGGCEIAGRMAQVGLHTSDRMAIVNLDMANAFNTMGRARMWDGVQRYTPALRKRFLWAYGTPTEFRLSDGVVAGYSATGSRQGDPLVALSSV